MPDQLPIVDVGPLADPHDPEAAGPDARAVAAAIDDACRRYGFFRVVGHGDSLHVENRFPGGDMNAYLTYAAMVGAGLYGIEHGLQLEPEFKGNGYIAKGVPRMPRALYEAIGELERSKAAVEIFGQDVVDHYLNAARVEHYDELKPILDATLRTRAWHEWIAALLAAGVPCGAVRNAGEVLSDPQLEHRGMIATVGETNARSAVPGLNVRRSRASPVADTCITFPCR